MKLTNKQKTELAAIVIFKTLEREIEAIRAAKKIPIPNCDDEIIKAISDNLNAATGKFRKTKPRTGEDSASLYYALRYRQGKNNGSYIAFRCLQETTRQNQWDTIALLILSNAEKIREYAREAIGV